MEKKRLFEASSSEFHLPEELWPEILSRLPAKSLLRFRCVSKSWLYLINDPDFCRVHLNNFNNNRDETHLLVYEVSEHGDCVIRRSDTLQTSRETCLTLPPRCREGSWKIMCVIDGLVLMKIRMFRCVDLLVWNPSIKKVYDIPPSPEIEVPHGRTFFHIVIGLAYDPLVKDYKLVKFIFMGPDALHSVAVYTLGAGSWKIIQFHGNRCSNWHWNLPSPIIEIVYLEGSFYFSATDVNRDVLELVSFDLRSEVFGSISLPACISSPKLVCNGCSSLVVFDIVHGSGSSMWVLESESVCWTQLYSFNFSVPEFLYLKKNRDMLMLWYDYETSLCLSTGSEILEDGCRLVSSYNPATKEEKILLLQKESDSYIFDVYGYIESLVMLK